MLSFVVALWLVTALAACSSSTPSSTPGSPSPTTGSLKVSVYGLPGGVSGAVTVSGPAGYTANVTATATLSGLAPGSYTVTAAPTRSTAAVVDVAYTVSGGGGSVTVSAGTTSSTSVTYDVLPGSGKLWIEDTQAGGADGFTNSQLTGSGGALTPAVQVKSSDNPAGGLAFDAAGDLWLGLTGYLFEYTPSQLVSTATPTPSITINNDNTTDYSLIRPLDLAFDPHGNLWVSECNGNNIEMFTPAQLAVNNSSPTPNAEITSVTCAVGMTFDAQGDLWFSEPRATPPAIAEFTGAQLAAAAGNVSSPSPNVVLTSSSFTSYTSNTPAGIAFDGGGNLWVANSTSTSSSAAIWMFPKSQIVTSGTSAITPSVILKDDGSGELIPSNYLAFDNSGDLWVSSKNLVEFAPANLQSSGHPAPTDVITIGTGSSQGAYPQFALDPPPVSP
ncbi:MAG TPA: hypothetical protein VKB31_07250 [Trueperaceae bacterium]|nr:hypothetical protein [Trueperaceae bacterium]